MSIRSRRAGYLAIGLALFGVGLLAGVRLAKIEKRAAPPRPVAEQAKAPPEAPIPEKATEKTSPPEPLATPSQQRLLAISDAQRRAAEEALAPFRAEEPALVPFTRFVSDGLEARLQYTPASGLSTLLFPERDPITFPRKGFPLKLVKLDADRFAVFFRETPSSRLYVYFAGPSGLEERPLPGAGDAEPILRESLFWRGRLLAILYDNQRRVNEIVEIDPATASPSPPPVIATLPSLEDPAGSNYEMMATLFMLPQGERLWVLGGTLVASLTDRQLTLVGRLAPCLRAQEAVLLDQGPAILCVGRSEEKDAFLLSRWSASGQVGSYETIAADSVPFDLTNDGGKPAFRLVRSTADIAALLRRDLTANQLSGVMELGSNNLEGRVAWSQIYFLNGLLDLLAVSRRDADALSRFGPLLSEAKRRLDIEMHALDRLLASDLGFQAKAFTAKREPSIFAVQTARLLLLANRYRREIPDGAALPAFEGLRDRVFKLEGHIDEFRRSTGGPDEPAEGRYYLGWPKGSAFYFDGLNVPYNHQNEWAYAVLDSVKGKHDLDPTAAEARKRAIDIIDHFLESVTHNGVLPARGVWPYWWGRAARSWTEADGISVNTPAYPGDHLDAFISFRSIDTMSVLAAERFSAPATRPELIAGIRDLVSAGKVYPFVSASFLSRGYIPVLQHAVAQHYARMTAPWEMQNAVWGLLSLPAPGDSR